MAKREPTPNGPKRRPPTAQAAQHVLLRGSAALAALLAPALLSAQPALAVSIQQTTAGPAFTNTVVRYEVTVRNGGSSGSASANVRVDLPAGFTAATGSGTGFTCTTATGGGSSHVDCASGPLPVGQSRSFRLAATTPRTITADRQTFSLTARAGSNTATISTIVRAAPDLHPYFLAYPSSATASEEASYDLALENIGDRAAADVALIVELPLDKLTFVRFGENDFDRGCSQPDGRGKLTCLASSLQAGTFRRVKVRIRYNPLLVRGDSFYLKATAELRVGLPTAGGGRSAPVFQPLATSERDEGNNWALHRTTITGNVVDLTVEAVRAESRVGRDTRGNNRWHGFVTFRAVNRGPGVMPYSTRLSIDAPCNEVTRPSATDGTGRVLLDCTCTSTGQVCPLADLAPGGERTFTFTIDYGPYQRDIGGGTTNVYLSRWVKGVVDSLRVIQESNERNNEATLEVRPP